MSGFHLCACRISQTPVRARLMSCVWGADINTGEIDKPAAEAAQDPNKAPALPKPTEHLAKQSNVSLAEVPTESPQNPEHSLGTAYKAGVFKAAHPDKHNSHADTALVNSKALSPSGPSSVKEEAANIAEKKSAGSAKAPVRASSVPDVTAREV